MHSLSVPKENNLVDESSIEKEIRRMMDSYGNDILRISYMYLKDIQKAEDAFQEVFIKVYKKYDSFKGKSSEKTWLIRIAINVCKDMLRSAWFKRVLLTDKALETGQQHRDVNSIEDGIIEKETGRTLYREVVSLPEQFKDVIILYYYQGFDTTEISNILGVASGTVRSRLHRAREMLKSKLEGRVDFND